MSSTGVRERECDVAVQDPVRARAGTPAVRSGTFVAHDQRGRALIALAELTVEQGYERTTVAQIAGRSGVPPELFDRLFATKDDCLAAAYEATADQALGAAAWAYASTRGSWAEAIHAGLGALLEFAAGSPAFTRLIALEGPRAGALGQDHLDRALDRFAAYLEPDRPGSGPPSVVGEAVAGAVFEVICRHAAEQRVADLPDALPAVALIALSPFVGADEAQRVAGLGP